MALDRRRQQQFNEGDERGAADIAIRSG
jgi:hypothetical protein